MTMTKRLTGSRLVMAWAIAGLLSWSGLASAQADAGAQHFQKLCSACHSIGGGKRVGPDLKGVTERRSKEWLVKWIASSSSLVKQGDPDAVALFEEYGKLTMPDTALPPAELEALVAYLGGAQGSAAPERPRPPPSADDIDRGLALFQGSASFQKGGPACSACHHVSHDAIVGGGVLAKELTTAYERLGPSGLEGILKSPPFPVMARAFHGKELSAQEIDALTAYLQSLGGHAQYAQPRADGLKLLLGGSLGAGLLMALYAALWRRRKTEPVNQRIFARQTLGE